MRYQRLGRSELKVSRIGMGCWAIGGQKWGPVSDADSVTAVKTALGLGVNFFDTADYYGLGHSERILGEALGKSRSDVVLATKVGLRWNKKGKIRHDLSPEHVFEACEQSLKRLKTDWIDLYQIHWPDPNTPLDKTLEALEKLVLQGKIRYIGASNLNKALLNKVAKNPHFVSFQGPYNLLNREAETKLIPWCQKREVGFVGFEPLLKGILTGKFTSFPDFPPGDMRKWDPLFGPERFSVNKKVAEKIERVGEKYGMSCTQISLSLLLKNTGVSTLIPGAKTKNQVVENVSAIKFLNDREVLDRIEKATIKLLS